MAAAAGPVCPEYGHGTERQLITDILFGNALVGSAAYDTLILPMYKTHAEHEDNWGFIAAVIYAGGSCTCARRPFALAGELDSYICRTAMISLHMYHNVALDVDEAKLRIPPGI